MFDVKENFEGEERIAEMLSSLNRVDAPGDFDVRVRARIARGKPVSTNSWSKGLFRVGASIAAAVIIALGGYFALRSMNSDQGETPSIADTRSEQPQPAAPLTGADPGNDTGADGVRSHDETAAVDGENGRGPNGGDAANDVSPRTAGQPAATANSDRAGGGSIDMAARESKKVYPLGLDPNAQAPANSVGVDPNARISVLSILEFIGVKATWAGNGWRVDSVAANNIAERSGLKTGDVIEAINGQPVDKKTTFSAKFEGKSVRVRRDGASLSINFIL